MLANKLIHAGFTCLLSLCIVVNASSVAHALSDDEPPDPYMQRSDASGRSVTTYAQSIEQQLENTLKQATGTTDPPSTVNSQRSRETAEGSASSDAQGAGVGQVCDGMMHMYEKPDGTTDEVACLYFSAAHPAGGKLALPTTQEILYYAATTIHADGAGINKQPPTVSYTNRFVPTIVSVTSPTQTHVINLLGRDITITLTATNYEYSWGDGTPNTVTTSPGLAWEKGIDPNKDPRLIRHYYTPPQGWRSGFDGPYPHENREITLRTTWSGTATNPFTGETQTINGLVTTTETTGPFPLSHLVINNTDTWEEKQGH